MGGMAIGWLLEPSVEAGAGGLLHPATKTSRSTNPIGVPGDMDSPFAAHRLGFVDY
jgi:hypothetical protein